MTDVKREPKLPYIRVWKGIEAEGWGQIKGTKQGSSRVWYLPCLLAGARQMREPEDMANK